MRFPGFEGEWEKRKIRDFTRVVAGATPSTGNKSYWGGDIRWMNSGELNLKRVYDVQGRITREGYEKTSTKMIPLYSVLIGLAGQGKTRGTAAMNYVELCTNQSIASILPSQDYYPEFLYQNIESRYKELRDISSGDGGRGGLNLQMINNLDIPYCSLTEQKKIGDFLYLLDQRITIQSKLIEDLRILKKAIIARLFQSSEGEMKTLGELTVNFSNRNKQRIPYPMFSVTNDKGFIPQSEQFEDREMEGEDIAAYKLIHTGDIAYNPARINVGSIAQYKGKATCMISSLYVCIKAKKAVSDRWLMHILKSERLLYYYNLYAEGGVRLYLFYPNFSRIKVFTPPCAKQEIIADCLDAIEKKVEQESVLLNDLMKQKKFFLSRLFL